MTCVVLGDSIAVGTQQYLPQCPLEARVGITSTHWLSKYHTAAKRPHDTVIVSLGANDLWFDDYSALERLRRTLVAKRVIWLIPANHPKSAHNVKTVAYEYGDETIDVSDFPLSPDHIHPTGESYKAIAEEVEGKMP